uniref:Putative secreted protein n=1 Tax=Anopheles darlingi TaxID=43151 RepID=A0A2M4D8G5_ANODA
MVLPEQYLTVHIGRCLAIALILFEPCHCGIVDTLRFLEVTHLLVSDRTARLGILGVLLPQTGPQILFVQGGVHLR